MDWLNEILGEDLYHQVTAAVAAYNARPENAEKQIKLGNLGSGQYVSRKKYDDDIAAKDAVVTDLQEQITVRNTDLKNLQDKLNAANGDQEKYKGLISEMQTKYEDAQKDFESRLEAQKYEHAVGNAVSGLHFSSNAAKKAFTESLIEKKLTLENDTLLGFDDYVSAYKADDPGAFAADTHPQGESKPSFMAPAGGPQPAAENKFGFNFTGVREKIKT